MINKENKRLNNLIMLLKRIIIPFAIGVGLFIYLIGLIAVPHIANILLNIISNIVTIVVGILGIYAFYLWRRQQVHAKQLDIFNNMYAHVLQVNDFIIDLYSPLRISACFETAFDPTVKKLSDKDIKSKIIQYRLNKFSNEQKIISIISNEKEIFNIYFPELEDDLNKFIRKIDDCILNNMQAAANPLNNYDDLNDEYIKLIRDSFSNCFDPKFLDYRSKIIEEIESYKVQFANFYGKLIK